MRLVTFRDSPHSTRVGILENEQVHGLAAETMIEWLRGEGRVRTGTIHPLKDVHCTILRLLGLDDNKLTYFHAGRFKQLSQVGGQVIPELLG